MKDKFLVVYEDVWNNKESVFAETGTLGDEVEKLIIQRAGEEAFAELEIDTAKLNSEDPYAIGTFGPGFYDIDGEDDSGESFRVMIFSIWRPTT